MPYNNCGEWVFIYDQQHRFTLPPRQLSASIDCTNVVWHTSDESNLSVSDGINDRQEEARRYDEIPAYHEVDAEWRDQPIKDKSKLLFGIELEIDSKFRRKTCTVAEELGFIGEDDGSLDEELGIEIVGKPMELEEIRKEAGPWMQFLKKVRTHVPKDFDDSGYGMHVSVSRESMSLTHQIRFVYFIHMNEPLCEVVAGRENYEWANFYPKELDESALDCEKYEAASVRGKHRIEVRIFKSTKDPKRFIVNVEFCAAVVEFTKDDRDKSQLNSINFREWLTGNRKKYPDLSDFLIGKKTSTKHTLQKTCA